MDNICHKLTKVASWQCSRDNIQTIKVKQLNVTKYKGKVNTVSTICVKFHWGEKRQMKQAKEFLRWLISLSLFLSISLSLSQLLLALHIKKNLSDLCRRGQIGDSYFSGFSFVHHFSIVQAAKPPGLCWQMSGINGVYLVLNV